MQWRRLGIRINRALFSKIIAFIQKHTQLDPREYISFIGCYASPDVFDSCQEHLSDAHLNSVLACVFLGSNEELLMHLLQTDRLTHQSMRYSIQQHLARKAFYGNSDIPIEGCSANTRIMFLYRMLCRIRSHKRGLWDHDTCSFRPFTVEHDFINSVICQHGSLLTPSVLKTLVSMYGTQTTSKKEANGFDGTVKHHHHNNNNKKNESHGQQLHSSSGPLMNPHLSMAQHTESDYFVREYGYGQMLRHVLKNGESVESLQYALSKVGRREDQTMIDEFFDAFSAKDLRILELYMESEHKRIKEIMTPTFVVEIKEHTFVFLCHLARKIRLVDCLRILMRHTSLEFMDAMELLAFVNRGRVSNLRLLTALAKAKGYLTSATWDCIFFEATSMTRPVAENRVVLDKDHHDTPEDDGGEHCNHYDVPGKMVLQLAHLKHDSADFTVLLCQHPDMLKGISEKEKLLLLIEHGAIQEIRNEDIHSVPEPWKRTC